MKMPRVLSFFAKSVLILGGVALVYAGGGFYVLPALLTAKLPQLIRESTGRDTAVSDIQFNPFTLQLSLQGVEFKENNGQSFVNFDRLFLDIDPWQSIKQSAVVVNDIQLQKPFVRLARHADGSFNFSNLVKASPEKQPTESKIFPVSIIKLSIAEGKLSWQDVQQKEDITPLNFSLENFSTQADNPAQLSLSLAFSSGGKLDWQGSLGTKPLLSEGHLKLDNVQLARVIALAGLTLPADIQGSELIEADYQLSQSGNALKLAIKQSNIELHNLQVSAQHPGKVLLTTPSISLQAVAEVNLGEGEPDVRIQQGKFALHDFQFAEPGVGKPLVKIPTLMLTGLSVDLKKHELLLDALTAEGANVKAWLNADGVINYQALFADNATNNDQTGNVPTTAESPSSPWNIKINTLVLSNLGLDFEDQTLKKPVAMSAKPINLKLTNVSNQDGTAIPFQVSIGVNEGGLIKLDGSTTFKPFNAQAEVAVDSIALEKFQPYVDKFARLDIISGQFSVGGKLLLSRQHDKLGVKFTGNTGIAKLLTRDQLKNKDFVKWDNLTLQDVDVDLLANQYHAKKLLINKPYARVVIRKDKTSNFSDILLEDKRPVAKSGKSTTKAQPSQAAAPPSFKLDSLQIVDGASDFADLSLILPFAAPVKSLDGGASGISSEQKASIKVDLKGNAYELAPVLVKGEISPYLGDYNVELDFIGMPMPLISPYMVQFAGYKVEKGKITLGLKYKVSKGQLTASNSILIDQFELGEKVENPDAVSLPLELAIALMKDSDGKIKLNVPITGSFEDPQFSISHLVVDALVNSISKIITSPFRALASLVGSEADLSQIAFESGSAELKPDQQTKLSGLAKALTEKPELSVEIKGAVFQEQDWPSMQDDALYDQLKNLRSAEIAKEGGKKIRPEYVEISDEDYRRLMISQFMEKFPTLAEKSVFGGTPKLLIPSKDDFYAVAKQKLSALIKPEPQRLKNLASERAQVIAKYLVQKGGIDNDRVFTLDTVIDPPRENNELSSMLSLKVQ